MVVDERCEFDLCDYENGTVDILRGIPKAKGIEIAKRTLSAEIILVDEIGSAEECEALLSVGAGGVPIIATAHSGDFGELCRSETIRPLIDRGYFSSYVKLYRSGKAFLKEVREL